MWFAIAVPRSATNLAKARVGRAFYYRRPISHANPVRGMPMPAKRGVTTRLQGTDRVARFKLKIANFDSIADVLEIGGSAKVEAGSKKLVGAAMTSFMKKCEADATVACDKSATEKKLSGAAKTSFTKKCVSDAVGN
jgi:hypothetical protein